MAGLVVPLRHGLVATGAKPTAPSADLFGVRNGYGCIPFTGEISLIWEGVHALDDRRHSDHILAARLFVSCRRRHHPSPAGGRAGGWARSAFQGTSRLER